MKTQPKHITGDLRSQRKPLITAFESRILLDGAAVATVADALTDVDIQNQQNNQDGNSSNVVETLAPVVAPKQDDTREVAFVDTQIDDYQTLIDSLDDGIEVHLIDAGVDGLDTMVSMLRDQSAIDTLHIYSHGDVGELTLGTTTLTLSNLEDHESTMISLGESLSENGDILLYGCSIGSNDEGRAFVERIAEISGADVAASDDLTGPSDLDGDWDLEITSGEIESEVMAATGYTTVLAPVISNLDASLSISEGDPAVIIDNDITFTGGIDYTEGTIRFSLSSSNSGDQFTLTSAGDVNASGAISVLGSDVYLGNGSGRDRIGSIDATENGTNGQDLLIHFATPLTNSGFETGDLTGWTINNSAYTQINLDGVSTNYYYDNGATTGTATVYVSDSFSGSYSGQNQSSNVSTGSWALNLTSSGTITFNNLPEVTDGGYDVSGYGSWFGPYAVSDPFDVQVGDQLTLDWAAQNGSDSYDVFGYLVDLGADATYGTADDVRTLLFSERGSTRAWTTTSESITSAGTYAFEFIGGTYDQTGGKAVGASLYIDNVRLISATSVNDSVASTIARQVTYQNTATDSPTSRTLTITAVDANGDSGSDTMTINISQANNSPTFTGGATLGAVGEDTVSPTGSSVSSLFSALFSDPDEVYTPADTLSGIVITADASNSAEGEWQYSTDGGGNWYGVGSVTTDSGLMLSSSSLMRFVPSAEYNGTPGALNAYAVDSANALPFTSGATRETYDTTTDGAGDPVSATSVTLGTSITPVNDAPVAGDMGGNAVEAGGVANAITGSNASGNVLTASSDIDIATNGDAISVAGIRAGSESGSGATGSLGVALAGQYGSLTINSDGSYTYVVDENNAAVQALRVTGDTVTDAFTFTVGDSGGLQDQATLSITIDGRNDSPVASDTGANAVEAGGTANATPGSDATGNLLGSISDVDSAANGETLTIVAIRTGSESGSGTSGSVGVALTGQYGTLTLGADGSYTYVVDDDNASVQALRVTGQQLSDNFTYTVADTDGLQDQGTFTVTIDGRNDAPVAGDQGSTATETGDLSGSGSDATGNVLTDGSTPSTDVDSVANGESMTVVGIRTGAEGDSGTNGSLGAALTGQYGDLTLNADGSYTYVVDDTNIEVQALRTSDDSLTDSFTFTMSDTEGLQDQATLTITIVGSNDAPVAGDTGGGAVEASGLNNATPGSNATGNALTNSTDLDSLLNGENITVVGIRTGTLDGSGVSGSVGSALVGQYGSLTIHTDGTYVYVVNDNNTTVQALRNSDESLTDSFTFTASDTGGLTDQATLSISISGRNDSPLGTLGAAGAVLVEDGGIVNGSTGTDSSQMTVNLSDVDGVPSFDQQSLTNDGWNSSDGGLTYNKTGTYGSASLTLASGVVTYRLDNNDVDTQSLVNATSVTESFTLYLIDDQGATSSLEASFEINGANDNPLAADSSGNAIEASGESNTTPGSNASGNVLDNATDVDSLSDGETLSVISVYTGTEDAIGSEGSLGTPLSGQFGTLTLNSDGTYTYTVDESNADVQALRTADQQLTDTFTYVVADASGLQDQATLAITIEGRNDAPTLTDASLLDNWEYNTAESRDFSVLFNDPDSAANGEQLSYSITGLPAGLSYDTNTGVISGQPIEAGQFTLTLTVEDAAGTQLSRTFELVIESDATPVTETPSTPEGTETTSDAEPTQSEESSAVDVGSSELPEGLVETGPGDDGSAFIQGDTNVDTGFEGLFEANQESESGGDLTSLSDNSDTGSENQTNDTLLDLDQPDEGADTSTQGDESIVLSEQGVIVYQYPNPQGTGNLAIRAEVEVNVSNDGVVEFSDAQNDAFDLVSLYLSRVQTQETGLQLTISDSLADKVVLYTGSLADGSPLPSWIKLDTQSGNLSINPPQNLSELIVRIKAIDSDGQIRILELNLNQLLQRLDDEQTRTDSTTDRFVPLSRQLNDQQSVNYGERLTMLLDQ